MADEKSPNRFSMYVEMRERIVTIDAEILNLTDMKAKLEALTRGQRSFERGTKEHVEYVIDLRSVQATLRERLEWSMRRIAQLHFLLGRDQVKIDEETKIARGDS